MLHVDEWCHGVSARNDNHEFASHARMLQYAPLSFCRSLQPLATISAVISCACGSVVLNSNNFHAGMKTYALAGDVAHCGSDNGVALPGRRRLRISPHCVAQMQAEFT
jgi:hypothetical protein